MKIDNQDIARMARELRDEENQQLHVRPWNGHSRFRFPAWLAAIPAAAIIGFFFGIWTNSQTQTDAPLTALVDTVYITVKESPTVPVAVQTVNTSEPEPVVRKTNANGTTHKGHIQHKGQSMRDDNIRYDLLVKN